MERLFDETFGTEDKSIVSRNLWYGYVELYIEAEYGKQIVLDDELKDTIHQIVKSDISEDTAPTEINWYLYGRTKTTDAIEDSIRPTVMIRYKERDFLVRCNISDHDFAMNVDTVVSFENSLKKILLGE